MKNRVGRVGVVQRDLHQLMMRMMEFYLSDLEKQLAAMRQKALDALPGSSWTPLEINPKLPPERADIVIVGGGVVGYSIAYWLKKKERVRGALKVLVVEKDQTVRTPVSKGRRRTGGA